MERLAAISDIHGNRWALEAVLEDIDREGIEEVINLGDAVYGPLDPAGTADILIGRGFPTVRGNEDRLITDGGAPDTDTLAFVMDQLQGVHLEWLRSLKRSMTTGPVYAFHGSPEADTAYLLYDVGPGGVRPRSPEEVASAVGETESTLILCGHDHVPGTVLLPDGRRVVDPGSVGLQAFQDDLPYPHVMETGSPRARYSIISRRGQGWSVTGRSVRYDFDAVSKAAERNGRYDWAEWIRTGRAGRGRG